jgi:iron complex outermembrane recepter protein
VRWQLAPQFNLHASVARGFESPTLGELAYRTDGTGGFNVDLKPQKSKQAEVGVKWRSASGALSADVALFDVKVDDEISVATNAGGRQSFRNVGRTERRGVELSGLWRIAPEWRASTAVTILNATYRDPFLACAGIPCNAPTLPVAAGNRIAGTQRGLAFGELAWQPMPRTEIAAEVRRASALTANDINTEAAAPYTLFALRARQRYELADKFQLEVLARLDNAGNKAYASSVIVNDANGRYYETGAPRAWLLSARLSRSF